MDEDSEIPTFYRILPGSVIRSEEEGRLYLRSRKLELELEGDTARTLADHVLPLLDGRRDLEQIHAALPGLERADLRALLERLVAGGIVACSSEPWPSADDPLIDLAASLGVSPTDARARLATARIAVIGTDDAGTRLAELLRRCGVERLHHWEELDPTSVASVDVLVCTSEPQMAAVNGAALAAGRTALYGLLRSHRALAGPLVIPGRTACYQCWRIRRLACAEDIRVAMALEQQHMTARDRQGESIPTDPSLVTWLAGTLASDLLRAALRFPGARLAGRVVEHDFPRGTTDTHRVLEHPACPACGGEVSTGGEPGEENLLGLAAFVGPVCGWARRLERMEAEPDEPPLPVVDECELANHRFVEPHQDPFPRCWGAGLRAEDARTGALAEAAERYAGSLPDAREVVRARRGELDGPSLDPRRLVLFAPSQYASLPFAPWDEESVVGWVRARPWGAFEEVFAPALAVLLTHPVSPPEAYLLPSDTNGLAAGRSLPDAILAGLFEVLERDAFLLTWLHRLPARRVDPIAHPDAEIGELVRAQARCGVSLELYALPTDHPVHVFAGLAIEEEAGVGPAIVVGLGADLDPARAARSALIEAGQVRPSVRRRLRDPAARAHAASLLEDPHMVRGIDDHALRYALPPALESFAFLRDRDPEDLDWSVAGGAPREDSGACLDLLADHLRAEGADLLTCDLTSSDVGRFGVSVARVLVPGFQPLHFGRDRRRLGGSRLFTLPRRLGLRATDATIDDLNDDPHPLA